MGVVKRINVNDVERTMNTIIELSSKISFLQEELLHLDRQLENNRNFLSAGILSNQAFLGNKKNFEKKVEQIRKEINQDVRVLLKLSKDAKKKIREHNL